MTARRVPVFADPDIAPDDLRIAEALGDSAEAWNRLAGALAGLGLDLSWRHYRDGGWLCRAVRDGANLAWLAVWDGCATLTCYFAARHRERLAQLPLPEELRVQAARTEMSGRLLPLVIEIRTIADAEVATELVRFKLGGR